MTTREDNPQDWFLFGADRLRGADVLFQAQGVTYLGIEALHEAAVERYLKGYLVSKEQKLERTHDLARLLERAMAFDDGFEPYTLLADDLTQRFRAQHYPGGDLTDVGADYEALRKKAGDLIDLILKLTPQKHSK